MVIFNYFGSSGEVLFPKEMDIQSSPFSPPQLDRDAKVVLRHGPSSFIAKSERFKDRQKLFHLMHESFWISLLCAIVYLTGSVQCACD